MRKSAMMMLAAVAGLAAAGSMSSAASLPQAPGRYTAEQAAHGAQVYAQACAMCHKEDLGGDFDTPPLVGRFARNWSGSTLASLADYLHRAMPEFAPGSLSAQDNADVLAYLLQANGEPAGARALPSDPSALAGMPFRADHSSASRP
ncbi:c-type cytochrome [Novosphingobium terrae]|uniref:c-type cytochrome n=1 Tax=Novosphingobium terrae TaxID=2726189 RepID=UPI00197F4725|nr:cytochrome c [Novosphingobium terrae]